MQSASSVVEGLRVEEKLDDILAGQLAVIFCGINPGVMAAAQGHHFAGRGNRFWRTLHLAGFTPEEIRPENDRTILQYQCGLTAVVERPTARADQLSLHEFMAAAADFERKIARYAPRFVAFLGKAAYCALSGQREVSWGFSQRRLAMLRYGYCPIRVGEIVRLPWINWLARTGNSIRTCTSLLFLSLFQRLSYTDPR